MFTTSIEGFGQPEAVLATTPPEFNSETELRTLCAIHFFPWPEGGVPASLATAFRSTASLIVRINEDCARANTVLPDATLLSKVQLTTWGLAFQVPSTRGLLADRTSIHFKNYFLDLNTMLQRTSLEVGVPLSLVRKWGQLLGFPGDLAESSARERLLHALRGRPALPSEVNRASSPVLLRILQTHGCAAGDVNKIVRPTDVFRVLDLHPTVGEWALFVKMSPLGTLPQGVL